MLRCSRVNLARIAHAIALLGRAGTLKLPATAAASSSASPCVKALVQERISSGSAASTSYIHTAVELRSRAAIAQGANAAPSLRRYHRSASLPLVPEHLKHLLAPTAVRPKERIVPPLEPRPYTAASKRSGLVAVKAGMTQEWDEWGERIPLTVLWVDDCEVVRVKTQACDGVNALVLGTGSKKEKQLRKPQLIEYRRAGIEPKAKLIEFSVTPDALLPPGTKLGAAHFVAGQHVDVTGTSKGKGFQGVMKRWGFAGGPASHGATKVHRAPGAIGTRNWPGRVWKGKKMAGREGHDRVTVKNVWIYKVDPARNLIYVLGQVPGPTGSFVQLKDAHRVPEQRPGLPFPTQLGAVSREVSVAKREKDPFKVYVAEVDYFEERWKGSD